MSIRLKVLGIIILTYAIIFSMFFFAAQDVVLGSFETLETETTEQNVQRTLNVLQDDADAILTIAGDWGAWDDTRDYALGDYPEYVEDNLYVETATTLDYELMLFFDNDDELLDALVVDLEKREEVTLPESFAALVEPGSILLDHDEILSNITGFVRTDDNLVMIASRTITDNLQQEDPVGTIIFGRYIDEARIKFYAESLQFDLTIMPYTEAIASPDLSAILKDASPDNRLFTQILSDEIIAGYGVLRDIYDEPTALITIKIPREIYAQGVQTMSILAGVLSATGLVISIVTALVLEAVVLRRVTQLSEDVNVIQYNSGDSKRVQVSSNDEVSSLAKNINQMLHRLDKNQVQLEEQNKALTVAYDQAEEATRLKSDFLSTMSHELRTPLNSIIGYSGLITEGVSGEVDEEALNMVARIESSGTHLLSLINDILDISKIEAGRMELIEDNFAVRAMIETIQKQMSVLAEGKNIGFEVNIPEEVPQLFVGDRERISQIIINLLSNGIKFTDAGQVELGVKWQDKQLVMTVSDTGIGIAPHALQYVFDEFRQADSSASRKYQGTGLGLAIVKKLCQAMDGQVTVTSTLNVGTVFTVTLPLKPVIDSE